MADFEDAKVVDLFDHKTESDVSKKKKLKQKYLRMLEGHIVNHSYKLLLLCLR
jgi:hypothetical protein